MVNYKLHLHRLQYKSLAFELKMREMGKQGLRVLTEKWIAC